jgi:hypothetical protein
MIMRIMMKNSARRCQFSERPTSNVLREPGDVHSRMSRIREFPRIQGIRGTYGVASFSNDIEARAGNERAERSEASRAEFFMAGHDFFIAG